MPTPSNYPTIDIPRVDLWTHLFENKDRPFPDDKVLYVDAITHRSYTYAQVKSTALDFGKGLKALWDWQKGDVLALYSPNSIDTPSILWGCLWTGGIVTTANPGYTVDELVFQLKDAGAKAIVTQVPNLETARKAAEVVGIPDDRIILIGEQRDADGRFKHFTSVRNISGTSRYRKAKIDPEDLAFLPYSSGTTGRPKGVMLCHRNIVSVLMMTTQQQSKYLSWTGGPDGTGDKVLAFLPFFHIYGLTVLLHIGCYMGLETVVMSKFDMELLCKTVQDLKITFTCVAPPVVLQLAKHPVVDKYDLSSIKMINSGAAPLTKELIDDLYKRAKIPTVQGYGLSETSPTTHLQAWEDWDKTQGSVGKLLANQTAKYMSPDEEEVPVGQVGELWIKGPNIFKGYLNNPTGTAHALTSDNYFKTGDVGYQDAAGNFYITDRVKELIKYKGFQVPPAELEGKLAAHPKINDVAVLGVYDKAQATEVPRAYVVPSKAVQGTEEFAKEIMSWLESRVANHKRLRGGVRFVDEIPKSPSGKILRRVLKARAQEEDKMERPGVEAPVKAKL